MPIPKHYHCEISSDGGDFVLLLADMAPAVQGDQIGGCTLDEAALAVRALAGLHGPTWCDPRWTDFPGLAMSIATEDAVKGLGDIAVMATQITLERLGSRMTAEDRETATEAMSMVTPWLMADRDRFSLMHGDYRLDNMLFDPDRTRVTVVDWQTLGVGLPARDLAYFTGTSLLPEARSLADEDLVAAYHAELSAYGITDYDRETCWRDYRVGMLQVPLLTTLGCAFAISTERGDDMMLVMLRARLPGHPRSRQPGPRQSPLTQAAASATVDTVRTPSGRSGRRTITTGIPERVGGIDLGPRHVTTAVLRDEGVDAVLGQQLPLAGIAVGAAREQQFVPPRQRLRVRRGHRPDQEPRVDAGERRAARPPRGEEDARKPPLRNDFRGFDVGVDHDGGTARPGRPGQHDVRHRQLAGTPARRWR